MNHADPNMMEWLPEKTGRHEERLRARAWDTVLLECGTCSLCMEEKARRDEEARQCPGFTSWQDELARHINTCEGQKRSMVNSLKEITKQLTETQRGRELAIDAEWHWKIVADLRLDVIDEMNQDRRAASKEQDKLREQLNETLAMLAQLERSGRYGTCPVCLLYAGGEPPLRHSAGCKLGALLERKS